METAGESQKFSGCFFLIFLPKYFNLFFSKKQPSIPTATKRYSICDNSANDAA
jgi:hypothetical protein